MNVTHPLITNRRFISPSGRLQVQYADGSGVLGYVVNADTGPCVPFATLGPSFPHTLLQDWNQFP